MTRTVTVESDGGPETLLARNGTDEGQHVARVAHDTCRVERARVRADQSASGRTREMTSRTRPDAGETLPLGLLPVDKVVPTPRLEDWTSSKRTNLQSVSCACATDRSGGLGLTFCHLGLQLAVVGHADKVLLVPQSKLIGDDPSNAEDVPVRGCRHLVARGGTVRSLESFGARIVDRGRNEGAVASDGGDAARGEADQSVNMNTDAQQKRREKTY